MQKEKISIFIEDMITLAPVFKKNFLDCFGSGQERKISNHQFYCAVIIYKNEQISMSALARNLGISKQQLTRIVDELVSQDIAVRSVNPRNRRIIFARLSEEGKKRVAAFIETAKNRLTDIFSAFSEAEIDEAIKSLCVLCDLFNKISALNA
ncbi:MAG: MarR family transcriptional regulator [Clostridiales bacterium]|jgi:DNA-binding MarR family transcriptional regulator|nr:MarR family transcriptional regulator [Clostridiales bacterium]